MNSELKDALFRKGGIVYSQVSYSRALFPVPVSVGKVVTGCVFLES